MYFYEQDGTVSKIHRLPLQVQHQPADFLTEVDLDGQMLEQVLRYYEQSLPKHDRAKQYLEDRCLLNSSAIKHFRLGYADRTLGIKLQRLDKLEEDKSRGALQRLGLVKPTGHEFFRGAIVFPFTDVSGEINGGYGRRIAPRLRWNSSYHVHWLTEKTTFFNTAELIDNTHIILCKNPLDALSWWCSGFKNTLALMGVHSFSQEHLVLLNDCGVKVVYLAFGATEDELSSAWLISKRLKKQKIESHVVIYPDGKDANALLCSSSEPSQVFQHCLDHSLVFANSLKQKPKIHLKP